MRCSHCGGYRYKYRRNSDAQLRQLERIAAQSGSTSDRAKVIIAKVRLGIISEHSLALAAYLGDPAAKATGIEPWDDSAAASQGAEEWAEVRKVLLVGGLDRKFQLTCATDFIQHVLPVFEDIHPDQDWPRLTIQAIRDWLRGLLPLWNPLQPDMKDAAAAATDAWINIYRYGPPAVHIAYATYLTSHAAVKPSESDFHKPYRTIPSTVAGSTVQAARNLDDEIAWQTQRLCDYLLDRRQIGQPYSP
jgi:hypothetical protein